jgi:hypothetical protein
VHADGEAESAPLPDFAVAKPPFGPPHVRSCYAVNRKAALETIIEVIL